MNKRNYKIRFLSITAGLIITAASGLVAGTIQDHELLDAAFGYDIELVRKVLADGANVNALDNAHRTPLLLAVRVGEHEIVKVLIDKGADPNIPDAVGRAPIHTAIDQARWSGSKSVQLLIEGKADVNILNADGATPLHLAEMYKQEDIVKMLKNAGAEKPFYNTRRSWKQITDIPRILSLGH